MGEIEETPVGSFTYEKVRKGADTPSLLRVDVYLLRVDRQLAYWPEASQRTLAWMSPDQAVSLVSDAGLGELIAGLRFPTA